MKALALVPPALRALLADRGATPRPSGPRAYSEAMFHELALRKVSLALTAAGARALLVKGAALALTVYAEPAARLMTDIDLLVPEEERDRVVGALAAGGFLERPDPTRPYSAPLLGETGLFLHAGAMTELVEVQTTLSKLVPRPIDMRGILARASSAPGLPGLLVPSLEDHALLIAIHAAGHDFAHPVGFLDLELILRKGLDESALAERARAWRAVGVTYAMLSGLRDLGSASVTPELLSRFDPGPVRRALLRHTMARELSKPGVEWVILQTPLRDDPVTYAVGVGKYAVARARDKGWLAGAPRDGQDGRVPYRVPLWVRALLTADFVADRTMNVLASVRDEALLAWIPPEDRPSLTAAVYADLPTYLPGGKRFKSGLFSWEARILSSPPFPKSGRILLGAAGAGRELVALVERGFEVVAFDPCLPFADAARSIVPREKAEVVHASYGDLVDAAHGRGGVLAPLCRGKRFDAVVLGWGSLSHVMPSSSRVELLRAVRELAPDAPVLASFGLVTDPLAVGAGKGRVRNALRRAFVALGAPGTSEDRDHFLTTTGFFSYLTHDELARLAWDAEYEVALFEEAPYPHAVLLPRKRAAAGGPRA